MKKGRAFVLLFLAFLVCQGVALISTAQADVIIDTGWTWKWEDTWKGVAAGQPNISNHNLQQERGWYGNHYRNN